VELDTICGLNDTDVRDELWKLSSTQVAILLTRIVARVEHTDASNVNHKHCGTQHMACCVAPEADAIYLQSLMEVYHLRARGTT
jgi:hypothetical protein